MTKEDDTKKVAKFVTEVTKTAQRILDDRSKRLHSYKFRLTNPKDAMTDIYELRLNASTRRQLSNLRVEFIGDLDLISQSRDESEISFEFFKRYLENFTHEYRLQEEEYLKTDNIPIEDIHTFKLYYISKANSSKLSKIL